MRDVHFRCSSLGRLMTEPKTKAEGPLSIGAKTYIRELAAQEIFGVEFEISSREMEKGLLVEAESIALLNRVRGLSLAKNIDRRKMNGLSGECDLFDAAAKRGHDLKSSWSLRTFPIAVADCEDRAYEWQMRGYMALWDADEWEVNYAIVDTPEHLIGYEPMPMHIVSHLPEHLRLTTWVLKRDPEKEAAIFEKIKHARAYYDEVIAEFARSHPEPATVAIEDPAPAALFVTGTGAPPPGQGVAAPAAPPPSVVQLRPAAPAATIRLGQIGERLGFPLTAEFVAQLGFQPVATEKAAKLYREADFDLICEALIAHVRTVQHRELEAA
jgi:hypothetical protein